MVEDERDVVALANIGIFLRSNGLPKHRSFAAKEIDGAVAIFDCAVGSYANAHKMPILFGAAAELWAGLQREWKALSANEKQIVRDYIQRKSIKPMPVHLYSRLFGLSEDQARQLQNYERVKAWSARMSDAYKIELSEGAHCDDRTLYIKEMTTQNCPICGTAVKPYPRYPKYVCNSYKAFNL